MAEIDSALKNEIRTASMYKLMWKLTPVAVIAMSINSINTFVDALFIGQYLGETALAGVSLAFPLTMLTNGLAAMIGVGGSSLLSRCIGSDDRDTLSKIFGVTTILSVIISIGLMIFGWIFADEMIALIGGKGEVLDLGSHYYRILVMGAFFQIFAVALNFLIRAEGKLNVAMRMSIIAVVVNIILNPLFIGYLDMGLAGAAYATILSMVLLLAMGLWYYLKGKTTYTVDFQYFKLDPALLKPILGVGVSAMMMQIMFLVQNAVVFKMISLYGDDWDIAFMGACYRILFLMIMPGFGFSTAVQPVIGINYGAGDYERVKEAFFTFGKYCVGMSVALLIIFQMFPHAILGLLLPNSTFDPSDIFNFRIRMLPVFLSSLFIMVIVMYQSIGQAKVSGIVTIIREIVLFLPFVIFLPRWWGLTGVYAAPLVQNLLVLFIIIYILKSTFDKWDKQEEMAKNETANT